MSSHTNQNRCTDICSRDMYARLRMHLQIEKNMYLYIVYTMYIYIYKHVSQHEDIMMQRKLLDSSITNHEE